jgi:hypothetical protein
MKINEKLKDPGNSIKGCPERRGTNLGSSFIVVYFVLSNCLTAELV